jgi:hypothetical protein
MVPMAACPLGNYGMSWKYALTSNGARRSGQEAAIANAADRLLGSSVRSTVPRD